MIMQLDHHQLPSRSQDSSTTELHGVPTLPIVIHEHLVHRFKYWNQCVRDGMRFKTELYEYCEAYHLTDRLKAYSVGCEYANTGKLVCITISNREYIIWLGLRCKTVSPSE